MVLVLREPQHERKYTMILIHALFAPSINSGQALGHSKGERRVFSNLLANIDAPTGMGILVTTFTTKGYRAMKARFGGKVII